MGIIKTYHDKKWTLQFLDALYNSIDLTFHQKLVKLHELCNGPNLMIFVVISNDN
jgi:hypothetical protein